MDTPDGLHELSYARHILEEVLGWPAKGNLEMMGDCIRAISKSKKIPIMKAHGYMVRAIKLAKEQEIKVDHFFFQSGGYTEVKPAKETRGIPFFVPPSKEEMAALAAHKKTPECIEAQKELVEVWSKLAGKKL